VPFIVEEPGAQWAQARDIATLKRRATSMEP
jgi:hypothetical protein